MRGSGAPHSLAHCHDCFEPDSAPVIGTALALLLAGAVVPPPPRIVETETVYARTTIIRVPAHRSARYRRPGREPTPPPPPRFKEKRGPKCIDAAAIGGAAISSPDSVDFILKGGQRVRAQLENECPALDYYSGFYVRPPEDGRICADRDSIHTRSGGDCQVDRFRLLTPLP